MHKSPPSMRHVRALILDVQKTGLMVNLLPPRQNANQPPEMIFDSKMLYCVYQIIWFLSFRFSYTLPYSTIFIFDYI